MTDRRRAPRYHLCRTTKVEINLLQDVSIQSAFGDEVVVLASNVPAACDRLLIQMVLEGGELASLAAEVVRTAPVVEAGVVRFRLELRVDGLSMALGLGPLPTFG